MRREKRRNKGHESILALLFITLFLTGDILFSQEAEASSEEVRVYAHYQEKLEDRIIASGNVEVHYKDIRLFADRIEFFTETKDVYAEGNVSIHLPDEIIDCERIRFNLDSSRGELNKAFGRIQPSIFYEADSIQRKEANLYTLRKAKITACTQANPRWNFAFSKANFKKDDYVEMWHSVFSIKKIPIFYLPYMRYPLDKERATGFLTPQLGYSENKGIVFSEAFYWALKRNMDATVNFDYYSERGIGGGLEYRYLFSGGIGGNFRIFYFRFKENSLAQDIKDAYILRFNHNQPLPFRFSLRANVDYQSSYNFLREFDNNFKRAVVANRQSLIYLQRTWSHFAFKARISRFETYYRERDRSIIKHNLPRISFSSDRMKIISPLYFSFSSLFDRWEHGWDDEYEADEQKRSQNFTFKPRLTIPFKAIPWLNLTPSFLANFDYYFQSYAPGTKTVINEPILNMNYTFNMKLIGPVFTKVFYDSEGTAKLKHIIEPAVVYKYESPISAKDRIINIFGVFRLHRITYSLTNRFLIKKGRMPREILTIGLSQAYYFNPEESPLSRYPLIDGEIRRFDDVKGYIRFYPARRYSLDVSVTFNPYYNNFPRLRLGANLGSPQDSLFCGINWFKSKNPYRQDYIFDRQQISFWGGVKIPKLSLEAFTSFDYNIQERKMLYQALSVVYSYQCLDFKAELKIFYFRDRPETQFRISFGLGNIGKTTDFLGGF